MIPQSWKPSIYTEAIFIHVSLSSPIRRSAQARSRQYFDFNLSTPSIRNETEWTFYENAKRLLSSDLLVFVWASSALDDDEKKKLRIFPRPFCIQK